MSQARKCFGASGLSFLLCSWTLDLKMLVPFYLGAKHKKVQDEKIIRTYNDTNLCGRLAGMGWMGIVMGSEDTLSTTRDKTRCCIRDEGFHVPYG